MFGTFRKWVVAVAATIVLLGMQPFTGTASAAPVVGAITITYSLPLMATTGPQVALHGVLATPAWSCVNSTWTPGTTTPFRVTCTNTTPPTTTTNPWSCDVLHADARTQSQGAKLRTSMLCDGNLAAQTATVSGAGGWDYDWGVAGSQASSTIECVTDNGDTLLPTAAIPSYAAFCGDPPNVAGLFG